jgi:hypothetical protein
MWLLIWMEALMLITAGQLTHAATNAVHVIMVKHVM